MKPCCCELVNIFSLSLQLYICIEIKMCLFRCIGFHSTPQLYSVLLPHQHFILALVSVWVQTTNTQEYLFCPFSDANTATNSSLELCLQLFRKNSCILLSTFCCCLALRFRVHFFTKPYSEFPTSKNMLLTISMEKAVLDLYWEQFWCL